MQVYTGTVKYEAGEPYVGNYGPRINVVIENLNDPNAPKAQNGELKVYKKPESQDGRIMANLKAGDNVQLVYTENGDKSYYNFIGDAPSPQAVTQQRPTNYGASPNGQGGQSRPQTQVLIPINDEQRNVFITIAEDEIGLLADVMAMVYMRFGDKVSEETKWRLTATAYINASKKYRPNYILLDDQPDPEPENYSQVEPEPEPDGLMF